MKLLLENWKKYLEEVEREDISVMSIDPDLDVQDGEEDYPEVRDALLNFFPEAEIIDIELIGSSALSPEEREAQDIEKYGFSRGDERDTDLLATITGIDEDDAERWAFSEEAEELEMFYNFDVQVLPERLEEKWSKSERRKRAKKCDNPKGFSMKQFCDNLNEEEAFQKAVKKKHKKMKIRLIGLGGGKNTRGTKKPSYKRSKSAPPGFGGSLEENK